MISKMSSGTKFFGTKVPRVLEGSFKKFPLEPGFRGGNQEGGHVDVGEKSSR